MNGATLQRFLEANGVGFRAAPPGGAALSAADVGALAARYTVAIECARSADQSVAPQLYRITGCCFAD